MLPCVLDHRRRQNVVRTSTTHSAIASCTMIFSVLTTFWRHQQSIIELTYGDIKCFCLRSAHIVPATSPQKNLHKGTCPKNSSHVAVWGTSCRDFSKEFKLVWILGTSRKDQSWSLWLDFEAKMASSLSPRLVAATSPLVCADLKDGSPFFPRKGWSSRP